MAGLTCIVTVHGIGFQQAPDAATGTPGYADGLHQALAPCLSQAGLTLGSDPQRTDQPGPVYVQGHWPPASRDSERFHQPLSEGAANVAHVALVYSHLEDQGPQIEVTLETLGRTLLGAAAYVTPGSLLHMLVQDVRALRTPPARSARPPTNLLVRAELRQHHQALWSSLHLRPADAAAPPGLFGVLRALENDVAAYVYRNDLRERVRGFVRQSLEHLAARDDVDLIVLNTHSQGTVVGFDVLKDLSEAECAKVRLFVTAGSPLRKYVDLFNWGNDAGATAGVRWLNFMDDADPVADRLSPPAEWKRGDPLPADGSQTLFEVYAAGGSNPVPIEDKPVNNVLNSLGTDLRAHNYWDNSVDFVPALASAVAACAGP